MVVAFSGQVCFFAGSLGSGRHETYLCRSDRIVHRDGPYLLGEGSMVARLGTAREPRSAKIKLPILTEGSPSWWCCCCSMRIASVDLSLALKHVAAVSAGCKCRELCRRIVSQRHSQRRGRVGGQASRGNISQSECVRLVSRDKSPVFCPGSSLKP